MDLEKMIRGKIFRDEHLSKHSSFGIGGKADYFALPYDLEDVKTLFSFARESKIGLKVIGNGTNILFRDEGFRGMVMELPFRHWTTHGDRVTAGAATPLTILIMRTIRQGLAGLEPLSGIPGTVGGSIITNAGTVAGDASGVFHSLRGFDTDGNPVELKREEVEFSYRKSSIPKSLLILEVSYLLHRRDPHECEIIVRDLLRRRKETQPTQVKNVGCIFKNPNGFYAGKLIDEVGLKGTRVGNAEVSLIHGNFILNQKGATSREVLELIQLIQERVKKERGIQLELEIEIV